MRRLRRSQLLLVDTVVLTFNIGFFQVPKPGEQFIVARENGSAAVEQYVDLT